MSKVCSPLTACLFILATALPLAAESWSFSVDNDLIFGSDDHYTGGFQIGWMSDRLAQSDETGFSYGYIDGMSTMLRFFYPFDFTGMRRSAALSLQGVAVTPDDTQSVKPIYNDVPYMGSATLTSSLYVWNETLFHEAIFTLGVIGPASGADVTQDFVHCILGNDAPKGWSNQVDNRLVLQAGYVVGVRQYARDLPDGYTFEWFNSAAANAGSSIVNAGAGSALRIGKNIPKNFVSINGIINRSLAEQLNGEARSGTWGWSVDVGLFFDLIAYSYLEAYAKTHGYTYEHSNSVITGRGAFDLYYRSFQLSLELYPSRPLGQKTRSDYFGRMNLTYYIH